MATIKDVANRAGVSPTTVSHIINKTRHVSDELTSRVMAAIEDLDYRPYGLARSLRRRQSRTVGVLVPDNTNPYFAEVARLLEDRFFDQGYNVIICNTEQNPQKELAYLQLLIDKAVEGAIFVSTGNDPEAIEMLRRQRMACVLVDRDIPDLPLDRVVTDNQKGAEVATDYLLGQGHRRILCIAGPQGIASTEDRLRGYQRAMERADLPQLISHGDFRIQSGLQKFLDQCDTGDLPSAVFASNDLMALGVLHGAAKRGMRVPHDLSVIGFDDIHLAEYAVPALTTLRQEKSQIVEAATTLLLERIASLHRHDHTPEIQADLPSQSPVHHRVLAPTLIIRESSGPASQREHDYP